MKTEAKVEIAITCNSLRGEVSTLRNAPKWFGAVFVARNATRRTRKPHRPALEGSWYPGSRLPALRLLLEGNSLRSTQRITDLDINTLMKILVKAGEKCETLMSRLIVNVPVKDVQADEIWSLSAEKRKAVRTGR